MPNRIKYPVETIMGKKFGRLLVIGPAISERNSYGKIERKVLCKCDCGNEKYVNISRLCTGQITSCGCGNEERKKQLGEGRRLGIIKSKGNLKDGRKKTRLYSIWSNMNSRCKYECCSNYKYYGGRGIKVCDNWNSSNKEYGWENFKNWAYANGYSEYDTSLEIDRIDHDGDYEPGNCRFANRIQQLVNKGDNVLLTFGDITKSASEWATALGVDARTLLARYERGGWAPSEILTIPTLPLNQSKEQYIMEHGIKPIITIDTDLYEAKYCKPFFDNEKLNQPLP